jgi:ribose/xylose/arabinose/galactoside ABC-type transport system permease subunit
MNLDLNFYVQISVSVFFTILFCLSLVFTLKSKREYRQLFILITLIALFCLLNQVNFFLTTIYFPNIKDLIEAILVLAIALTFLFLAKKIVKLT